MKKIAAFAFIVIAMLCGINAALAQGTAFIYHGQLNRHGHPARGEHDLRFELYDAITNGTQLASQDKPDTRVREGSFSVTLDFGPATFNGSARWLQISVKNNTGQFIPLTPRQKFMPTPYAIMANSASNLLGTLPASQISGPIPASQLTGAIPSTQVSGPIPASQLEGTLPSTLLSGNYSSALFLSNPANSFAGNGSALTGVNAAALNGLSASNFWRLDGNANIAPGSFLGTIDSKPLELKVNGQRVMRLEGSETRGPNIIGGAAGNFIGTEEGGALSPLTIYPTGIYGATISGGGGNNGSETNSIFSQFATIGGGMQNKVFRNNAYTTIAGGVNNRMLWDFSRGNGEGGAYSFIGGGIGNTISSPKSVIGGGEGNLIDKEQGPSAGFGNIIGGGGGNYIQSGYTGGYSTIGGGSGNRLHSGNGTIAGGSANIIGHADFTEVDGATIGGGVGNQMQLKGLIYFPSNFRKGYSVIGGGMNNFVQGTFATIPGGYSNYAVGHYSFAAGCQALASHEGAFVWADSSSYIFSSTTSNSFSVRSVGGVRFVSAVSTNGTPTAGVELPSGGGSWAALSDRDSKENFTAINPREVLERVSQIPVSTWNYKSQDSTIRHIGPMAQDFAAAFQVGENERRITTVDADGVALAAIQGLNQIVKEKDTEIQRLQQRLEKLERLVTEKLGGEQ